MSTRNLNFRFTSRILFNFGSTFELYEFLEDVAGHVGLDWIGLGICILINLKFGVLFSEIDIERLVLLLNLDVGLCSMN